MTARKILQPQRVAAALGFMSPEGFQTHRLWGNVSPTAAKASRYGIQQGLTFRRIGHLVLAWISRWPSPEGLETRTGFMTLHLLHPHTGLYHTVKAKGSAIGSHPMVTAASRFSNPEGLQTHRGSMALDLLHPYGPPHDNPTFRLYNPPSESTSKIVSPQLSMIFLLHYD